MDGYTRSSYGDAFADVYDEWYPGVDGAEATADLVAGLAKASTERPSPPRVLELAVGTGRLALPLADRGLDVVGVDASEAMLGRLRERDPDGRVRTILGDMVEDLPDGPFDAVLVAYNSLFNLETAARQQACFAAVAERLAPTGAFLVEAFVPEQPARSGGRVEVRAMTADRVVLDVSRHDPQTQRAEGHVVELVDGAPVRLRPWCIRYAFPSELDAMGDAAGLVLADRWGDVTRAPFSSDSARHVSVYRRA